MAELEKLKRDYAELVVKSCMNIQKGQRLVITCNIDNADFARLCASEAYDAGCKEVVMWWVDEELKRMKYLRAADDVFDKIDSWYVDFRNTLSKEGAAFLHIESDDPELLNGVDPDRITRAQKSAAKPLEAYRKRMMRSECPWTVCSVPSKSWAKAVFPELSEDDAVERLWEEILKACRVDGGDAIKNWKEHVGQIKKHVDIMNGYRFKTLKYKNSAGTDVTFDLAEGHIWTGGEEKGPNGTMFAANIPTEEVFTVPDRRTMNGTLVATKPLSLNGSIVDGFSFKVKDGKIVEVHAEKGEDILKEAVSVDEGASYFGEVALVPFDSPINKSGVLFLNTLFDENAACHFAFGEAYPCIEGVDTMTEEEFREKGVNSSMTHIDFMVGSEDLEITGITHDGREIPVFRNGNFVF